MELVAGARLPERTFGPVTLTEVPVPGVLYLVISGAPAPEGLPCSSPSFRSMGGGTPPADAVLACRGR
jgi:hypothetical protein